MASTSTFPFKTFMCRLWARTFILGLLCICLALGQDDDLEDDVTYSSSEARNVSREAYNQFHLVLSSEEDDVTGQDESTNVVFANGKVSQSWIPLTEVEVRDPIRMLSMFHHDQYTDRISFEYSFGSFLNYDIRSPIATTDNEDIAKPKVVDYQIDEEDQSGSFTVVYDCHRHPVDDQLRNTTISVVFPVVGGLSLYFSFRKSCGGGHHKFIELGYFEESSNAASEVSRVPFISSSAGPVFGPHVISTKLYIHLYHPAMSQEFFHVNVSSASPSLLIHSRGQTFGGIVKASESTVLHLLYDCQGNGKVEVSLSIPIFPFHELSAHWVKDCGGGDARGLHVGTRLSNMTDVVASAETRYRWKLAMQTEAGSMPADAPLLNSSTRVKDFWLSNDGIPIHVAPAIITVGKPDVLVPILSYPEAKHSGIAQGTSIVLPQGEHVHIQVRMICKRKGHTQIIVTFPIKAFSNVEFGFFKACKAPRRHVHSGFLRTANSVMAASTFLLAGTFAYWWIWQLRVVGGVANMKPSNRHRPQK